MSSHDTQLFMSLRIAGHAALQLLTAMGTTVLSGLGAIGAAASKASTERQRKIEDSDVAFLIRARDVVQKGRKESR